MLEKEENKPETGEQRTGPAAAEGTNHVASSVTPTDWQSKNLDGHVDDDLDLDGSRQSSFHNARVRSRSPALGEEVEQREAQHRTRMGIIAENNTSFFWSSFQQEFLSMSSEFTFGDNSDKLSIFSFLYEFG